MSTTPETTQTYASAYATLKKAAAKIEAAGEDDLDTVIQAVEQAREAKTVCESRLKAANEKLAQLLGQEPG